MKKLLLWSVVVGIAVMIVLTLPLWRAWTILQPQDLDSVVWATQNQGVLLVLLDALIWQWLSAAYYLVARYRFLRSLRGRNAALKAVARRAIVMVGAVGAFTALWTFVLSSSLMTRPSFTPILPSEGIFTQHFYGFLRGLPLSLAVLIDSVGPGAASGFVVFQTLLVLAFMKHWRDCRTSGRPVTASVLAVAALSCMVVLSRLIVGQHSLRDVGLAIGIGTISFWIGYALREAVERLNAEYAREVALPLFIYIAVGQYFCHDQLGWLVLGGTCFALLGLAVLYATRAVSLKQAAERRRSASQ